MSQELHSARAEALIEALPYIQQYRGKTIVIKYGGSAMEDDHIVERMLRDVVFLEAVGINPVVIHGGGKAITLKMRDAGQKAQFVNGLRVTNQAAIRIVEEVLDREINPKIVSTLNELGGNAVGISGKQIIKAEKLPPQVEGKAAAVDLGFVGEATGIDLKKIQKVLSEEKTPVISPIAQDENGVALNVNADIAAGAIAIALKASKLMYLSDVLGIMRDPREKDSLIPSITSEMIETLIEDEVIEGGMIPKVRSAVDALAHGVGKVHLIDGRIPHSLLLEIFTNSGVGTEITN